MNIEKLSKELGVQRDSLKHRIQLFGYDLEKDLDKIYALYRKGSSEPGWYTNGILDVKVNEGFLPPEGFVKGRTNCGKNTSKGRVCFNNGESEIFLKEGSTIPEGFVKGSLPFTQAHKERIRKALKGKAKSEEYKRKSSELRQTDSFKEKIKSICLERYGVDNVAKIPGLMQTINQSLEINSRKKKTWSEKSKEELEAIKNKRNKTWSEKSEEELEAIKSKRRQIWSEKSEEEKEAIKSKSRQTWKNKTLKEREAIKDKIRQTWSEKSDEEIKAIQSKRRKKYFFEGLSFDSSWELEFYKLCKLNGLKVKREPVVFDYEYSGTIYHYIPDFEVEGILVEIKNSYLFNGKTLVEPYKSSKTPQGKLNAKYQCLEEKGVILLRQEDFLEFFSTLKVE